MHLRLFVLFPAFILLFNVANAQTINHKLLKPLNEKIVYRNLGSRSTKFDIVDVLLLEKLYLGYSRQ